MNVSGTFGTAILRGAYNAVGTFGATFLLGLTTASPKDAAILAGIAALSVLGFRGGGEGLFDKGRQAAGNVKQSDVQPGAAGKP